MEKLKKEEEIGVWSLFFQLHTLSNVRTSRCMHTGAQRGVS